ncbi:MAG: response regulator transcription factor, partial [Planctomycetota bacterium]
EDEESLARGLAFNFTQEGYEVTVAGDGRAALRHVDRAAGDGGAAFDVVVLDLMLPGMSGYEVCREIRRRDGGVPVIILSARTLSEDRTLAFDAGADQYLGKPFALPELLARVRNVLSRRDSEREGGTSNGAGPAPETRVGFGSVEVDFDAYELTATRDGATTTRELTPLEAELLKYFVRNPGRVLSRDEILARVWPAEADVTTRTVDNFVLRLRKMIEADPAVPRHLLSVRGAGYRFVAGE